MRNTTQERYSVRESRSRWLALKLNIGGSRSGNPNGSRPIVSAVEGLPGGLLRPGISPQRGACLLPAVYSAGGFGFLLALRTLSPARRKISEFSTNRSAIAVAIVVLYRMFPHSEKAVFVVMIVERL